MTTRSAHRPGALVAISAGLLTLASPPDALAGPERRLALVIGVNRSVDRDLKPLRYADDDAARYAELFTQLGAQVELLTRLDAPSARLFTAAKKHARPPRMAALREAVTRLRARVRAARKAGQRSALYLVYAGHGRPRRLVSGKSRPGYISLEDSRLTAKRLANQVLLRIGADRAHVIVDACHSYFLALARGPGGKRRAVRGFARLAGALQGPNVGLLLSTSSARESHEWAAFQAGVFSHAVRSGLRGAADADRDGQVTYREIAAFITRANAAIPNERFRSKVFARSPRKQRVLVTLGARRADAIEIGPSRAGRYLLEDARGVRLADLHSAPGQSVLLLRPAKHQLYLRRLSSDPKLDDVEYAIAPGPRSERVVIAKLQARPPHVASRGAAHHAFSKLFALPFDRAAVEQYRYRSPRATLPHGSARQLDRPSGPSTLRRVATWGSLGLAAAALGSGLALTLSAVALRDDAPANESQQQRLARNDDIDRRNTAAIALYAVGGVAAVTSLVLFVWPDDDHDTSSLQSVNLTPTPGGATLSVAGRF
jgi:hypothetical protein